MTKNKQKNGFSLVEVVVAVGIMAIGMVGVLSLVIQNIQVQSVNKNFLIASMLAQEGLELTRNTRDANWLTMGNKWWESIYDQTDPTFAVDNSTINYSANNISSNAARLWVDGVGFYSHVSAGNTATQFYRLMTVTPLSGAAADPDAVQVEAHVQWTVNNKTFDYLADTYLYNWR